MSHGRLTGDPKLTEPFLDHPQKTLAADPSQGQLCQVSHEAPRQKNTVGTSSRCCCHVLHQYKAAEWLLLLTAIVYNLLSGIEGASVGLLYVEYTVHFQVSKAAAGWVSSVQFTAFSLFSKFWSIQTYVH